MITLCTTGISSGGFSNYFTQPKYQKDAVAGYLAQGGLPTASYYNTSGRAFPDVAAFSEVPPPLLCSDVCLVRECAIAESLH
jgi:hypothetical protein